MWELHFFLVSFRRKWGKPHLLAEALQPLAHSSDTRHAESHSACSVLLAKWDVSLCCQCSPLLKFQWGCQFAFGLNGSILQWFDVFYLSQLLCAQLLRLVLVCMLSDWIIVELFCKLLLSSSVLALFLARRGDLIEQRRTSLSLCTSRDKLKCLFVRQGSKVNICVRASFMKCQRSTFWVLLALVITAVS